MTLRYRGIEVPANDRARVDALKSYGVLDTPPEQEFDDITELAARITGCRVAYIALFDDRRSWLKASYGLPKDRPPRPRELSLCSPTLMQSDLLIVPDLSVHPRYRDLPAVVNPPHARFYCAMPLINPEGYALGTLCVWDPGQRELDAGQQQAVRRLARLVLDRLEARRARIEAERREAALAAALERARADAASAGDLVRNLFPGPVAGRLLAGETVAPCFHDSATVMFADFVDFSCLAETLEPRALIEQLDAYFSLFDRIVAGHGLEKVKTMGDAYLAVSGLPDACPDHALRVCRAAHAIARSMDAANADRRKLGLMAWQLRIGVHSGHVIAGIVGDVRARYDVWGDGVNIAKRVQEAANPGCITLSEATYGLVSEEFEVEELGPLEAKHKGRITMYRLDRPKVRVAA